MTRDEAINWIINLTADIGKMEHQDLWHYEQALEEIRDMIEALPSAQPEIIYCKDCKHRKFVDFGMGDCLHPSGCRGIAFDNHFCALGERRNNE